MEPITLITTFLLGPLEYGSFNETLDSCVFDKDVKVICLYAYDCPAISERKIDHILAENTEYLQCCNGKSFVSAFFLSLLFNS